MNSQKQNVPNDIEPTIEWMPLEGPLLTKLCYACREGLSGETKECYACRNDLVDDYKDNGDQWVCDCSVWECRCEKSASIYCPICESYVEASAYLNSIFNTPQQRWFASMVTHYRHHHRAWDRSAGYLVRKYGHDTYERQKHRINEQAKRQIMRKAKEYMAFHGVSQAHVKALLHTTAETMKVAEKLLKP